MIRGFYFYCFFFSFSLISKQFSIYLRRPDHKQEFISQWQDYYNGLDKNLRHEEVVKAELHHRVDVSRSRLWAISRGEREV